MNFRYLIAILLLAPAAWGATATCWPQDSTLNRYSEYFCAVDAEPGGVVTGRQLMTALAELEPVPHYMVANAGGDQNRGGIRRRFQRVEQYGLPVVSGLTAGDVIQINEPWLRAIVSLMPVFVPALRSWVGAATPPEWEPPPMLTPEADIPLDSHGAASVTLYTRKEGGVRRVSFGDGGAEASNRPPSNHNILWPAQLELGLDPQDVAAPKIQNGHPIPPELDGLLDTDDLANPQSASDVRWVAEWHRSRNNEAEAEAVLARGYQVSGDLLAAR